jgi:hypothetical protein
VPVEDGADRSSVDAELIAQFVGCRSGRVALDERLGLIVIELPCSSRFGVIGVQRAGAVGSGSFRSSVSTASTCAFVL